MGVYRNGAGLALNQTLCLPLCLALSLALSACSPPPSFEKGEAAYRAQDYAGALKQWAPLADTGDARAQKAVGDLYYSGRGVGRDPARAAHWYAQAADRGNADAETALGTLYMTGQGAPQDFSRAREQFAKAAAQDQPLAAYRSCHPLRQRPGRARRQGPSGPVLPEGRRARRRHRGDESRRAVRQWRGCAARHGAGLQMDRCRRPPDQRPGGQGPRRGQPRPDESADGSR